MTPVDRFGTSVAVGTRVRILYIAPYLQHELPTDEWEDLQTMVGEIFAVCEIDEYGAAWVEKWFECEDGGSHCHSLALAPEEMEVVV